MADNNSIKIAFEGDATALEKTLRDVFKKTKEGAEGAGKGADKLTESVGAFDKIAGSSFGGAIEQVKSLGGAFGKMLPILGAVAVAAYGIKEAFEFAKIGEENEKARKQFEELAKQSHVFADTLIEGLDKVSNGLYDTDDLIKVANKSLVELGENAKDLPKVFELSQKAVKVFGGDAKERMEEISQAVANLQTRGLKGIGLKLDDEKILKDYARSLGRTTDEISKTEKQQVLLNAVLKAGEERFAGVSAASGDVTISNGLKRLSTGYDNLRDSIAAIAYSALGTAFAKTLELTGKGLSAIADGIDLVVGKPKDLETEFAQLNAQLERYDRMQRFKPNSEFANHDAEIDTIKKRIEAIKGEMAARDEAKAAAENAQQTKPDDKRFETDQELEKRIKEFKDQTRADELKAETEHQYALSQLRDDPTFEEKEKAKTDYKQQLADIEYQQQVDKNAKIDSLRERQAANEVAFQKKNTELQKVNDQNEIDRKKAVADAKTKIEDNLFATGLALAKEGSEFQKAIQIAQAIRNTYQGATLALATYPPPFGGIAAATTVALGLANVAKITGANDGALVTGGQTGIDSQPFLLSKGEVVAPAKSFDEVVEGTARQRGFIKGGEGGGNDETNSLLSEIKGLLAEVASKPQFVVNGDVLSDQIWIARLAESLRDAVQFRGAQLS